jgi:hypothetical protein
MRRQSDACSDAAPRGGNAHAQPSRHVVVNVKDSGPGAKIPLPDGALAFHLGYPEGTSGGVSAERGMKLLRRILITGLVLAFGILVMGWLAEVLFLFFFAGHFIHFAWYLGHVYGLGFGVRYGGRFWSRSRWIWPDYDDDADKEAAREPTRSLSGTQVMPVTAGDAIVCSHCHRAGSRGFVPTSGDENGTPVTYCCASVAACERRQRTHI